MTSLILGLSGGSVDHLTSYVARLALRIWLLYHKRPRVYWCFGSAVLM